MGKAHGTPKSPFLPWSLQENTVAQFSLATQLPTTQLQVVGSISESLKTRQVNFELLQNRALANNSPLA